MIGRRSLILVLTSIFMLVAAPSASAPWSASFLGSFAPVIRIGLTEPDELTPAEKLRVAAINSEIPAHPEMAIAAPRFSLAALGADPLMTTSALDCMTAAIYFEAANEPISGQRAVAQVILNRVRHPAFPDSVCTVVFQGSDRTNGCQFTFTCDGSLGRTPSLSLWQRARSVAAGALGGFVETSVGHATHYHASYVVPYWAPKLTKLTTVGTHIFYQWNGTWSRPSAFSDLYASTEVVPQKARTALAGYLMSSDMVAAEAVLASTLPVVATNPERLLLSAPGARTDRGLTNLPASADVMPATTLKVGKSELIENRSRLKDETPAAIAANPPPLAD